MYIYLLHIRFFFFFFEKKIKAFEIYIKINKNKVYQSLMYFSEDPNLF